MVRTQGRIRLLKLSMCLALGLALASIYLPRSAPRAQVQELQALREAEELRVSRFVGPTSSQPLALTADDAFLIAANPDNNSVTLFFVGDGFNFRLDELSVGQEPNGVAFLPD